MFEPLRITAYLRSPVVTDRLLPIDSILYYQRVRERIGEQHVSIPGRSIIPESSGGMALPIEKRNRECHAWYYAASAADWPAHTVFGTDYWSKRFDLEYMDLIDFENKKASVNTMRGRYKGYRMPIFYFAALYVRWYVVGDIERINRLLAFCTHLGKKPSQGWGAVLRWEVEAWHEDWSERNADGKLMRAIPKPGGVLYGVRPSYWSPRHQFECELPEVEGK